MNGEGGQEAIGLVSRVGTDGAVDMPGSRLRGGAPSAETVSAGVDARKATERAGGLARIRAKPRLRSRLRALGGVVVVLGIWEIVSVSGLVAKRVLPTVSSVATGIGSNGAALSRAVGTTLEAWGIGLGVAIVAGVVLGTVVGLWRRADRLSEGIVRMMRPMPSLALIPVAILIAGLGLKMTAGLVAFSAFWPVFINTRQGVSQVENGLLESGRSLGMGKSSLIWQVVLPAAAPVIATGVQVAIGLAIVVTISVEMVAASGGLGQFVLVAEQGAETANMYAGIVVGGILGWALNRAFAVLATRALPWRHRVGA